MFSRLKIGSKLLGAFCIVAAIAAVVGGVGVFGLLRAGRSVEEIGVVRLPSVQSLLIIEAHANAICTAQRTLLNSDVDAATRQRQYDDIELAREEYEAAWNVYEALPHTPEEAVLWKQFASVWEKWRQENDVFFSLSRAFDERMAAYNATPRAATVCYSEALALTEQQLQAAAFEFRGQVQEWKNVLLRGQDPAAYEKYLAGFTKQEQLVQDALQQAEALARDLGLQTDGIAALRTTHDDLGSKYREALRAHWSDDPSCVQAVDETVRGIDRSVVDGMVQESAKVSAARRELTDLVHQLESQALGACTAAQNEAMALLDRIVDTSAEVGAEEVAAASAAGHRAETTAIAVSAAGVLLAVAFGLLITRMIVRPIRATTDMIKDIATGDGDLTKRLEVRSQDEVGELAKWFNQFVDQLHDMVASIATMVEHVSAAATEISASNEQITTGAQTQSSQTAEVATAIEEMAATVAEVARNAGSAAEAAQGGVRQATDGGQIVAKTVEGMNAISASTRQAADTIGQLGQASEEIGRIIGVINDIADQTNLLALNAAIEAARAGEHGRGFAVVADEVRKLAERTAEATREVGATIRDIQTKTGTAVEAMEDGSQRVTAGVELAGQAGKALQAIVAGVTGISDTIQQIAAASEEQSAASEQISRNIESITSVTRQNAAAVQQAAAASQQLARRATELQGLVGRFRIDRRKTAKQV